MKVLGLRHILLFITLLLVHTGIYAQGSATVTARLDAQRITVGDQARLFVELRYNPKEDVLQPIMIPDTFNHLEVVEKGKIDTTVEGNTTVFRQRLRITGFDSGDFEVPALTYALVPHNGNAYTIQTQPLVLSVQTVAVDTTKPFKPIKGIIYVNSSWLDYIWYIIGGAIFALLIAFIIIYFIRNKKTPIPILPSLPKETLQEKTLRLLHELDNQQLWQSDRVKEYYTELTDIIRNYVEERFHTPAMELTTDELVYKAKLHKEMRPFANTLNAILTTADLAKFAKAKPLPEEHVIAMENARDFINASKPEPQIQTQS